MPGKTRMLMVLAALLAATLAISGCGSSMKESGGDQTGAAGEGFGADPVSGIAYVGAGKCIECHQGFSWSAAAVEGYLAGKHVVHSTHITALEVEEAGCTCHDVIGDGRTVEAYTSSPAAIPADGLAAVTCEACHGAGGEHWGVGPIPVPAPGVDACGQCHATLPEDNHRIYHPEANDITPRFKASQHYKASVRNETECAKCHTDEGARLYRDYMTREQLELLVMPVPVGSPVQCRTCHDPHDAGKLLKEAVEDHGVVEESAQYATCTNCHGKNDAVISTDSALNELQYHEDRFFRVIADSHYDDPATLGTIEGYILDKTNEHVCLDCHDVHAVVNINDFKKTTTINEQWAKSAHGGFIGWMKNDAALAASAAGYYRVTEQTMAIRAAGATADGGAGPFTDDPFTAIGEKSCARCHTTTAAALFLKSPSTYSANQNSLYTDTSEAAVFKNLSGTAYTMVDGEVVYTALQKELITCWACHANNSGALRAPGPISVDYKQTSGQPMTVVYPDLSGSNVCVACHSSRKAGLAFKNNTGVSFTDQSFINPHYRGAAGILFGVTGYPFYGTEQYRNVSYFAHDIAGVSRTTGIGTNGPCVACHMSATAGHLFDVVAKDGSGVITTITTPTCNVASCHGGHGNISAAELEENVEGMEDALAALEMCLADAGYWFNDADRPYFFTDNTYATGVTDWTLTAWGGGDDDMGAAFNLKLLHADPGAFAHNRYYAKRLIFDSIDWISDGSLDGTIDLSGHPIAAEYMKAGYLTPTAIPRPGGFPVPLP